TGGQFTPHSAIGILSLIVWTLIITVSTKYCLFVMRANTHGEGGILPLSAPVGVGAIARHPGVVAALDPRYAVRFMAHSGSAGFMVLGGVFLCITGGEALYGDMGHFGKGPIRVSWYGIVLP